MFDVCKMDLILDGEVLNEPELLAKYGKVRIMQVVIGCKRTSGVVDEFYINYADTLGVVLNKGMFISVTGEIRTINKKETKSPVKSFIFADSITVLDSEPDLYKNKVIMNNAIIDEILESRKSYSSDEDVAVYLLELRRQHSRYSYIKATSWGRDAVFLSNVVKSSKPATIRARLQSYRSKSGNLYITLAVYFIELTD